MEKKDQCVIELILCIGVIGLITIVTCGFLKMLADESTHTIRIGEASFVVEIVDTEKKRQKGLSGRVDLCSHCGMLFEFDNANEYLFWMKGMLFDIDVVWINGDEVVGIREKISHIRGENEVIIAPVAFDRLLELPAGTIESVSVAVGQKVMYK